MVHVVVVNVEVGVTGSQWGGLLAEGSFTDPDNAFIIYLMAGGLTLVALLVAVGTVWWWKSAKSEHPALGPLEVMSTRRWWKGDYTDRVRRLEEARPMDAGLSSSPPESSAEPVDLEALAMAVPTPFDDLLDSALPSEAAPVADGTPPGQPIDPLLKLISGD